MGRPKGSRARQQKTVDGVLYLECLACFAKCLPQWHPEEKFRLRASSGKRSSKCMLCESESYTHMQPLKERDQNAASGGIGVQEFLRRQRPSEYRTDAYAQRGDYDGTHGIVPARPGRNVG